MNLLIRTPTVDDAADLARVRLTAWQAAYRGLIDQAYLDRMDMAVEIQKFREGVASAPPERVMLVAEVRPDRGPAGARRPVVGYVLAGPVRAPDPEYGAEIYAFYVLPAYQGQGIGRALARQAVGRLVEAGYRSMIIYVLRGNLPARKFYEAIGGRPVREVTQEALGLMLDEVGYGYDLTENWDGSPQGRAGL